MNKINNNILFNVWSKVITNTLLNHQCITKFEVSDYFLVAIESTGVLSTTTTTTTTTTTFYLQI